VKIQNLDFTGSGLKILFESGNFLHGENLISMIGRRWCLCHVFFLEKLDFSCCHGDICAVDWDTIAGYFLSFFVVVCIRTNIVTLRHSCRGWCNWYLPIIKFIEK
jgi:hypothetical protein